MFHIGDNIYESQEGLLSKQEFDGYHNGEISKFTLSDYTDKWVVLFFYPADFTFVCPTELKELAEQYEELQKLGAEVFSVSTDTAFVHKAWHDESEAIGSITFPMLADPTGVLSDAFGVYQYDQGLAMRGTFVIDPDGVMRTMEVHDDAIGRNSEELVRKIQAAQFVRENGGQVCPASWKPGEKTLEPGVDLIGKI